MTDQIPMMHHDTLTALAIKLLLWTSVTLRQNCVCNCLDAFIYIYIYIYMVRLKLMFVCSLRNGTSALFWLLLPIISAIICTLVEIKHTRYVEIQVKTI